jgi:hypothetical protein
MSGDQTTLDLQKAMQAGLVIGDDHPGSPSGGGPGDDAGRFADDETDPAREPEKDGADNPEPVDEPGEFDADDEDGGGIPDPDFERSDPAGKDYRFKSQEEAERGYRELQKKLTEISEERKKFREKLAEIEAREAESKKVKDLGEKIQGIYDAMYDEVGKLDPDDPEYSKQVARLQADAQTRIFVAQRETERATEDAGAGSGSPDDSGEGETDDGPSQVPATNEAETYLTLFKKEVAPRLAAAKIDSSDPVYLYYADRVGTVDDNGNPVPLARQVEQAIRLTRNYYNKRAAKRRSEQNAPLPRGGQGPSHPAQNSAGQKPVAFADIVNSALETRRIT